MAMCVSDVGRRVSEFGSSDNQKVLNRSIKSYFTGISFDSSKNLPVQNIHHRSRKCLEMALNKSKLLLSSSLTVESNDENDSSRPNIISTSKRVSLTKTNEPQPQENSASSSPSTSHSVTLTFSPKSNSGAELSEVGCDDIFLPSPPKSNSGTKISDVDCNEIFLPYMESCPRGDLKWRKLYQSLPIKFRLDPSATIVGQPKRPDPMDSISIPPISAESFYSTRPSLYQPVVRKPGMAMRYMPRKLRKRRRPLAKDIPPKIGVDRSRTVGHKSRKRKRAIITPSSRVLQEKLVCNRKSKAEYEKNVLQKSRAGLVPISKRANITYEIKNGQFIFRKAPEAKISSTLEDNLQFENKTPIKEDSESTLVMSEKSCADDEEENIVSTEVVSRIIDDLEVSTEQEEDMVKSSEHTVYMSVEDLATFMEDFRTEPSPVENRNMYHDIRDIISAIPPEPEREVKPIDHKEITNNALYSDDHYSSKPAPRSKTRNRNKDSSKLHQTTINAGQRRQGATFCTNCGTVYSAANLSDERLHAKECDSTKSRLLLKRTKSLPHGFQEVMLYADNDLKILMATTSTLIGNPAAANKINDVLEVVDGELGISGTNGSRLKRKEKSESIFLLLNVTKSLIIGCLVAEQITSSQASRFKQEPNLGNLDSVVCGISRLWVHASYRREGGATHLVDTMRQRFVFPQFLSLDQFAFLDPTPKGIEFATKYTGTEYFAVYSSLPRDIT